MNEDECGSLLRVKRKSMGLTIEEMAERLDISVNTLGNWERGKTCPDSAYRALIFSVIGLKLPERSAE